MEDLFKKLFGEESELLQPTKKGREEGQSQYMAHGHRAEEPFLKEIYEITQQCDATQASNIEAIYAPGMTMNRKRMYNRDSANGVAIDNCITNDLILAVPVEVKSRASVRTFQKERNNVTKCRKMLFEDSGRASIHYSGKSADEPLYAFLSAYYDANKSDNSDKDETEPDWRLNPILKAAIPNPHELVQILHHAVSWGVNACYFVVGGHSNVMAVYEVYFKDFIIDSTSIGNYTTPSIFGLSA